LLAGVTRECRTEVGLAVREFEDFDRVLGAVGEERVVLQQIGDVTPIACLDNAVAVPAASPRLDPSWCTTRPFIIGERTSTSASPTPANHSGHPSCETPGGSKDVVSSLRVDLVGKVVIDATNDVLGPGKLHALGQLTDGAHPVRAFNTLGWEIFADPIVGGVTADLLYAAEEGIARDTAETLIRDVGLEPVWLGGIDAFDIADSVTFLWFTLALQRKLGRRLAFKVLRET
jgi:hypothetical protein